MTPDSDPGIRPSKSQVQKAGEKVRAYHRGEITTEEYERWHKIVATYREQFEQPLTSVRNSLRYYLDKGGFNGAVSQRLKRLTTIIRKLTEHESKMNLARMRDIGGCRIVTPNRDDVYAIETYLRNQTNMHITDSRDYIAKPRESGYRALHLFVERQGLTIEIQLRSQAMHDWAQTVETFSSLSGSNYKQDGGNTPFDALMRYQSELHARAELGHRPTPTDITRYLELARSFKQWCIQRQTFSI